MPWISVADKSICTHTPQGMVHTPNQVSNKIEGQWMWPSNKLNERHRYIWKIFIRHVDGKQMQYDITSIWDATKRLLRKCSHTFMKQLSLLNLIAIVYRITKHDWLPNAYCLVLCCLFTLSPTHCNRDRFDRHGLRSGLSWPNWECIEKQPPIVLIDVTICMCGYVSNRSLS